MKCRRKSTAFEENKRSKAESMFEPSCQQSKNWLLLTAFVTTIAAPKVVLDEATEYFVVFNFYWFSLVRQLTDSLTQAKR